MQLSWTNLDTWKLKQTNKQANKSHNATSSEISLLPWRNVIIKLDSHRRGLEVNRASAAIITGFEMTGVTVWSKTYSFLFWSNICYTCLKTVCPVVLVILKPVTSVENAPAFVEKCPLNWYWKQMGFQIIKTSSNLFIIQMVLCHL